MDTTRRRASRPPEPEADYHRAIAEAQARTHLLIAESRELIAQAKNIRAAFPRIRPPPGSDEDTE